ncbi:MAG: cytochrome c [Lewinella sp.]
MKAKHLLPLLYASLFGILFILALMTGYALSQDGSTPVGNTTDIVTSSTPVPERSPEYKLGKALWNKNACGSCHNKNMKDVATAPALGGVTARWAAYPREDLHAWIRNSQRLIGNDHPRAKELWVEWKPYVMSSYNLEDDEVEALLNYIEAEYTGRP